MTAVEKLLAAHLTDVREQIAIAMTRADALEALIGKLAKQALTGVAAALPQARGHPDGWSPAEDELLQDEYPSIGPQGCAKLLPHRSEMAIRSHAHRLGITCLSGPGVKRPRVWCSQCDRNVLTAEAFVCASPFCKAGKDERSNALKAHETEEAELAERLNAEAQLPSPLA